MIRFACPQCHKAFQVEDKAGGNKTKCPNCAAVISIPFAATAHPPPPAIPPAGNQDQGASWTTPMEPPPRPSGVISVRPTPTRRRPQNRAPSSVFLALAGLTLVGIAVGVTLWATGSLSKIGQQFQQEEKRGSSTAVPGASTTPSAPNTAQSKSGTHKTTNVPPIAVSGELFVTTKGGDVKKAAGEKVYFTPITPELPNKLVVLLARADQLEAERHRTWEEGYGKYLRGVKTFSDRGGEYSPEHKAGQASFDREYEPQLQRLRNETKALLDGALETLLTEGDTAVADGEGKFKLEIPPGVYVLWTLPRTMGEQSFSWCKTVEVHDSSVKLILSEDSVFLYSISLGAKRSKLMHRLLGEIVSELSAR